MTDLGTQTPQKKTPKSNQKETKNQAQKNAKKEAKLDAHSTLPTPQSSGKPKRKQQKSKKHKFAF